MPRLEKKKKIRPSAKASASRRRSAARSARRLDSARELATLTMREVEILERIGEGRSTAQIADELDIAVSTVRKHRENMMRKLDLHTTAEIVLFVVLHRDELDQL